ncbi:MAG: molybdopterin-dependent oxidoreductase [Oleiphilaceae bacterium]|nr:molybdopterin-dependent oxidoreductase [Oleiphilaceae bacterium]
MDNGTHYRTCNLCEAMCGVAIDVQNGQIESIKGDDQDPFSHGHICPKAIGLKDLHEDPERLRTPIRKNADGEWEDISWDQALDETARRLYEVQQEHGNNAVGAYLGNPNVHNHGAMLAIPPFSGALGSKNRFSATSNDQLPHMLANLEMFGNSLMFPIPDIDRCDLFLCIGANPMASNGSLMSVPDFRGRLKALQKRDGRFVVIDPRRTETAEKADQHHFIRPGTDAFLLLAMMHTIFQEERIDPQTAEQYSADLSLLRLAALPYSPEEAATVTGIEADQIRQLARDLADTPRALIYGRIGTSTQAHGGVTTWLLYALNILTGKLDRPGGMMFTQPAVDTVALSGLTGQAGHFGRRHSRVKNLPEFGGEFPASTMADEMLTPGEGQIRAFVTVAGNPVLSSPNGRRLDEAFEGLDFMVSVDYYLNETTRHADIILPPTASLERSHYDLVFNAMAVRNVAKFTDALFPPQGDCRSDFQILMGLGQRLERLKGGGVASDLRWRSLIALGPDRMLDGLLRGGPYGATLGRLRGPLQNAAGRMDALLPGKNPLGPLLKITTLDPQWDHLPKGLSLATLRAAPHGLDLGPLQPSLPERLQTRDKRVQIAPRRYLQDLPRLHEAFQEALAGDATGDKTLSLIGRRHVRSNNSWMHNSQRLVKGRDRCTAMVHPRDASRLGLRDGHPAHITSPVGRITLAVETTENVMPGVICIPHGWGHNRSGTGQSVAEAHAGESINDIIDDSQTDPLSGVSVLNGQRVSASPVPSRRSRKAATA